MNKVTEEASVGSGNVRVMRLRHHGPIDEELPDVGDILVTEARGIRYLIVGCRPTRGHDPTVTPRRITCSIRRLRDDEPTPDTATEFVLSWDRRGK